MSKRIQELEGMIERLEDQAKKKKAELKSRKQVEINKQRAADRKARNRHIYKLGGMVEKMGLDQLPENEFLGLLALMNRHYQTLDFDKKNQLQVKGEYYREAGKKMGRV